MMGTSTPLLSLTFLVEDAMLLGVEGVERLLTGGVWRRRKPRGLVVRVGQGLEEGKGLSLLSPGIYSPWNPID